MINGMEAEMMLMSDSKVTKWMQIACAVMAAALIMLQFAPFWQVGDEAGSSASVNAYVWFPENHKDVGRYLEANVEGYTINSIVPANVLVWVLGVAGVILACVQNGHVLTSVVHLAAGACGAWGYLTLPAMQLGSGWLLHLALCLALVACGVTGVAAAIKEIGEYRAACKQKKG